MPSRRLLSLMAALCLALLAAGCGQRDDEEEAAAPPTPTATATPEPDLTDVSTKPVITSPGGEPPAELQTEDIVEGEGRRARAGDTLTMQYVGVAWSTGQEFDASWDRGEPFSFELGAGMVIPGWDEGIEGMRVGGRRQLIIPPDMAYGPAGSPPAIGPNETLIFVVDLLEAQ
jgi:peptidylprolyl isomerase